MSRETGDRGIEIVGDSDPGIVSTGGDFSLSAPVRPSIGRDAYAMPVRSVNADSLPSELLDLITPTRSGTARGDYPMREASYGSPLRPATARGDMPTRSFDPLALAGDVFGAISGGGGFGYASQGAFNVPAVVSNEGGGGTSVSPLVVAGGVSILGIIGYFAFFKG